MFVYYKPIGIPLAKTDCSFRGGFAEYTPGSIDAPTPDPKKHSVIDENHIHPALQTGWMT